MIGRSVEKNKATKKEKPTKKNPPMSSVLASKPQPELSTVQPQVQEEAKEIQAAPEESKEV